MRDRHTRELAERALVRFAQELGEHIGDITVIGGLNADLLTEDLEAPHQGTVDVDVLIEVGLVYDREDVDFGWLEQALIDAGFYVRPGDYTWRWRLDVEGIPVKLELLCDTPDNLGLEIALPGCATAGALNLSGPGAAGERVVVRELRIPGHDLPGVLGAPPETVGIRFADLGGYVLAKAAAVVGRQLDKDLYDLAFVLLHNTAGGPRVAGEEAFWALPAEPRTDYAAILRAALSRFADRASGGPYVYAEQRRRDGEETDLDVLVEDAIGAAQMCRTAFDQLVHDAQGLVR